MKHLIILISIVLLPFTAQAQIDYCEADFDFDGDCDGSDMSIAVSNYGRGGYNSPCPPDGPAPVPKTGQTTSWATGDDGDLQRGVDKPPLKDRFTDNGDGTVQDNLTGLIWLKNAQCFGTRTWGNALSDSNGLADGECGLLDGSSAGDWRLPSIKELFSLVHNGHFGPAVPDTVGTGQCSEGDPFNNLQSGTFYWSSTTFPLDTNQTFYVDMFAGMVYSRNKTDSYYLWPVRGGR